MKLLHVKLIVPMMLQQIGLVAADNSIGKNGPASYCAKGFTCAWNQGKSYGYSNGDLYSQWIKKGYTTGDGCNDSWVITDFTLTGSCSTENICKVCSVSPATNTHYNCHCM